jgi:hypothetical protein
MKNLSFWQMDPVMHKELSGVFNIIEIFETKQFDCRNIDYLISKLAETKKTQFHPLDRYVIVHFDTDFYWHGHGVNLNNLFSVWKSLDIPLYTMIYYTNHHGISQEIKNLCWTQESKDQPMVIETLINPGNYSVDPYHDFDADVNSIEKHALCMMMGSDRSHRGAVFNHLQHLTPSHIALTIKGTNDLHINDRTKHQNQ